MGHRSRKSALARKAYRSAFEPLEARCCPTASPLNFALPPGPAGTTTPPPTPVASVTTTGHSLRVIDPNAGDTIAVTDDGAGNVSVTITNGTTAVASGSGTGITNVRISATGGGDTITYGPPAPVTTTPTIKAANALRPTPRTNYEDISINAGKGGNTVSVDLSAGLNARNVDLDVNVNGGGNKVTETLGALTSARLTSDVNASGGNDTVSVSQTGAISASKAFFDVYGRGGNENLSVNVAGDVSADSLVAVNVSGGSAKGGDTLGVSYAGLLNGRLLTSTTGQGGNETISQNLTFSNGSTGKIFSFTFGGAPAPTPGLSPVASIINRSATPVASPNNITLTVADNTGTPSTLSAANFIVVDQTGDTLTQNVSANQTANVSVITLKNFGLGFLDSLLKLLGH